MGVPRSSWALVEAHLDLHSGRHSARVFCSAPFGFVHSYMHLERQFSKSGSFLVPFKLSSAASATVGTVQTNVFKKEALETGWKAVVAVNNNKKLVIQRIIIIIFVVFLVVGGSTIGGD